MSRSGGTAACCVAVGPVVVVTGAAGLETDALGAAVPPADVVPAVVALLAGADGDAVCAGGALAWALFVPGGAASWLVAPVGGLSAGAVVEPAVVGVVPAVALLFAAVVAAGVDWPLAAGAAVAAGAVWSVAVGAAVAAGAVWSVVVGVAVATGAGWPVVMGPAVATGADSPAAAVVVGADPLADSLPPVAVPDVAGAALPASDAVAVVEAVGVVAALGEPDALSGVFWVFMPKPRITAAMMIATTASPNQRERFTEPRYSPITRL